MQTGLQNKGWTLALGAGIAAGIILMAGAAIVWQALVYLDQGPAAGLGGFPLWAAIAFWAFAVIVITGIFQLFFSRHILRPAGHLMEWLDQMAQGRPARPVDGAIKGPLVELAQAISRMGEKTVQKQKEANCQRDEYQYLFEQVPCLITVQARDFKLIRYNQEFAEKFHPQPGDYCYHAYKGRNEKCENCPVEKAFEDGQTHITEEAALRPDGSVTHWIAKAAPVRDTSGRIVAAMEMNLDITRQKVLEKKLSFSEKNYREIFNNIPNPVFVLDREKLTILDCNQSVKAVYGHQKAEVIGRSFLELFVNDRQVTALDLPKKSLWEKVRQFKKDKSTLFAELSVTPSEYGGRQALLVIANDITGKLEAERQLIQAGKMATVGQMATGVAHELNQPLSVIKTGSSFLARKIERNEPVDPETMSRLLSKIDANVDRATKIITHMRQFGRMSDLQLAQVNVNEVWAKAAEMFSQQLKVRGIDIKWELEKDMPSVEADPDRLEQVFINLVLNARDAIESKWEDGKPDKNGDCIFISTTKDEKSVFIKVGDTGPGIPEHIAEKIFEPFFTTKEVGRGSGLGLSISYGIIKDCKGDISVQSQPGKGTVFTIRIPQKESL
ncbi:MAG: ATP-binding protein [Desulfatibacillaceae bacterium]|nr:ATP-binding protein [Desulfatibacillaceae bacterium]